MGAVMKLLSSQWHVFFWATAFQTVVIGDEVAIATSHPATQADEQARCAVDDPARSSSCSLVRSCRGSPEASAVHLLGQVSTLTEALELGVGGIEAASPDGRCTLSGPLGASESAQAQARCAAPGFVLRASRNALPALSASNTNGSFCAVSRLHRFVFVHVLKNGGTQTKDWLSNALCGSSGTCDPCVLSFEQCFSAMDENPGYFRWTWLRHPYDRALSVYGMAKAMGRGTNMANVSFAEFWLMGRRRWKLTYMNPFHALPQAGSVTSGRGSMQDCLAVDFLGSLATAADDMARLVQLLDADVLKAFYAKYGFSKPDSGNTYGTSAAEALGQSAQNAVRNNSILRLYLDELYKADFSLFHNCDE